MNGSTRLLLIAAIVTQYGCATSIPGAVGQRTATPAARGADADRMRSVISAALVDSNLDALSRAVAEDAVLVLPDGDTVHGRSGIAALFGRIAPASRRVAATFQREGVHACADGRFQDYGRFVVRGEPAGEQNSITGRYAMLWTPSEDGTAILNAVTTYPTASGRTYRRRPCPTAGDVAWQRPGITVMLQPGLTAGFVSWWGEGMNREIAASGWEPSDNSTNAPRGGGIPKHRGSVGHAVEVRKVIHSRMYLGATAATVGGEAGATAENRGYVRLDYDGVMLGMLAGARLGRFNVAAGPTYLHLNGTWTTLFETEHPPTVEPPLAWDSWSLGALAEVGFVLPVSGRIGFDVRAQHRYFPAADVPGYRGSNPMSVGFSHSSVRSGIALRF